MPRNIEIKASVPDIEAVARKAAAIADQGWSRTIPFSRVNRVG